MPRRYLKATRTQILIHAKFSATRPNRPPRSYARPNRPNFKIYFKITILTPSTFNATPLFKVTSATQIFIRQTA